MSAEDRKAAIKVLSDADSGLKTTLSAFSPSDSSYVPMANALVAAKQPETSIRGSWIRNAFTNHLAISIAVVAYLAWVGICLLVLRIWPLKILS